MKLNEGKIASGLFREIMYVIEKYEGTLYVPTVLGVLEVAKMEVVKASLTEENEDDEG